MGARAEGGIRVRGAEICIAPDDHAALERLKYGESRGEGCVSTEVQALLAFRATQGLLEAKHGERVGCV